MSFCLSSCFPKLEDLNLQWVQIEGGSFQMGSNRGDEDEKPIHTVTVPAFEMTSTEVTVAQYRACVEVGVCSEPETSLKSTYFEWDYDNHPVNNVSWQQAYTFAQWVGGSLPSESQWEYAARGGDGDQYEYAGSNTVDEVAWHSENSNDSTHPVGQKKANGYGLYDMSGNVREWVLDQVRSGSSYENAPTDGSPECFKINCEGEAAARIHRGGDYGFSDLSGCRVTDRDWGTFYDQTDYLGFRVVRVLQTVNGEAK